MGVASLWAVSESKTGISQAGPSRRPGRDGRDATHRGEPQGERTPCPPVQVRRPRRAPGRLSEPPGGRQNACTRLWGRNSAIPGWRQDGPARAPAGESPGEKYPLRAPRAGPTAPQRSRTSQTTGRAAKRLYAALRAKPGHPSRRPGWAGAGTGGAGADPPGSSPRPPPCRPDGPPLLPHVHRAPGGQQNARTRLWEQNRDIQTAGAAQKKAVRQPRSEPRPAGRAGPG